MPCKCKELRLSFHSSSSVFTGTFTYDLPSFGIVFRISCPGVTRSESLGARHSASFCAAATSSPGISPTVLRCHVTTIIRTTTTTAAAPASVRTRHGRARFPSLAAAAAASTRTRKFAEGSAPRATSGSSASNRAFRARTSSSSAEHLAQLRRCSSRSFAIAPVSAASRNGSFHFSHAFFISSRPTKVFAPRTPGTLPFLLECRAPRPHRQRPSLQPARAAERCAVFPAGVQFLSAGGPASPAARRPSLRQPSRVFPRCARRCLAPAAAGSLSGGSTPAGTRSGSPKRGIFPLPGATQTSGRRARMLPALHLPRRPNCPGCCTQSEKRAADSQRRNRQIPPRDYALRLWQSTHSRTRLSRLSYPFTYRHRAGATRSKNSTHGGHGWWAIRTTRKTLAPDGGHRRPHPAACRAFPIRRERWVGMPAESVATGLQSARLEVSATAQCRGSPSSGQENSAVPGPSAAARHESESRLLRPARGSHRNSADYQAAGSGLALFGGGAQVLPGAPEAVDPARSPGRAAIGESQPQPARATFLARSPERLASAVVAAFSRCLASTGRVLSSAAWI